MKYFPTDLIHALTIHQILFAHDEILHHIEQIQSHLRLLRGKERIHSNMYLTHLRNPQNYLGIYSLHLEHLHKIYRNMYIKYNNPQ